MVRFLKIYALKKPTWRSAKVRKAVPTEITTMPLQQCFGHCCMPPVATANATVNKPHNRNLCHAQRPIAKKKAQLSSAAVLKAI
jgi:hypothetical protein